MHKYSITYNFESEAAFDLHIYFMKNAFLTGNESIKALNVPPSKSKAEKCEIIGEIEGLETEPKKSRGRPKKEETKEVEAAPIEKPKAKKAESLDDLFDLDEKEAEEIDEILDEKPKAKKKFKPDYKALRAKMESDLTTIAERDGMGEIKRILAKFNFKRMKEVTDESLEALCSECALVLSE